MSRVAIFGVTADPFTVAHRAICKAVMDQYGIDKLFVIPTVVEYHRKGKERWLTDEARMECIREMLWTLGPEYEGRWEIDWHELHLKRLCHFTDNELCQDLFEEIISKRRFIHTLLDFKTRHATDTEITLVLGQDEAQNLPNWHRWKDVLFNVDQVYVVAGRDDDNRQLPSEIVDFCESISPRQRFFIPIQLTAPELLKVSASKVRKAYMGKMEYDREDELHAYLSDVRRFDHDHKLPSAFGWA